MPRLRLNSEATPSPAPPTTQFPTVAPRRKTPTRLLLRAWIIDGSHMCQLVKLDHQLWAWGSAPGLRVGPGPPWLEGGGGAGGALGHWKLGWWWFGRGVYKQDRADHPRCGAPPRGPTNKQQEVERQKQARGTIKPHCPLSLSGVVCLVCALMFCCIHAHLSTRFKGLIWCRWAENQLFIQTGCVKCFAHSTFPLDLR